MSTQYKVTRGAIRLPRVARGSFTPTSSTSFAVQGEVLPEDSYDDADIKSWLEGGRIAPVTEEAAQAGPDPIRSANPFRADPRTLAGKSLEDLIIMILEIDPDFEIADDLEEMVAVQILTSGWDPSFSQIIAPVSDRSRPEALVLNDMTQTGFESAVKSSDTPLSAGAQAGLDAAKARAQAPSEEA